MPSPRKAARQAAARMAQGGGALLKTVTKAGKRAKDALTNSLPSRKKDKKKQKPTEPTVCVVGGTFGFHSGQFKAIKQIGKLVQDPGQATVLMVSPHLNLRSDANTVTDLLLGAASASFIVTTGLVDSIVSGLRHVPSLDHPNVVARIEAPSFCPGPPTAGPKLKDCVVVLVEAQSSQLLGQLRGCHLEHVVEAHGGFSVVVSGVDGLKDPKVVHDLTYHLSGSVAKVLVVGGPRETAPVASRLKDLVDELRPSEALSDLMTDNIESVEAPEVCALTILEFSRACLGRGREDLVPPPPLDLMTDAPEGASTARLDDRVGQRVEIREWVITDGRHVCDISGGTVEAIVSPAVSGYVVQKGSGVSGNSRLVQQELLAVKFTTGRLDGELLYFCADDPVLGLAGIPQFDCDAWASDGNAVAEPWKESGASSSIYGVFAPVARDHAPHNVSDDWEPLPIGEESSAISRVWRTITSSLVTAARRLSGRGSSPAPVAPLDREVITEPCTTLYHSTMLAPDQTSGLDLNTEVNPGIVEARKAKQRQKEQGHNRSYSAFLQEFGKSRAKSGTYVYVWNLSDDENARRYTSRKKAGQGEMAREGYVHADDPFHKEYLPALLNEKITAKTRKYAEAWAKRTNWRAVKNEADLPPDRKPWTNG